MHVTNLLLYVVHRHARSGGTNHSLMHCCCTTTAPYLLRCADVAAELCVQWLVLHLAAAAAVARHAAAGAAQPAAATLQGGHIQWDAFVVALNN
jgi:hypothetical protein